MGCSGVLGSANRADWNGDGRPVVNWDDDGTGEFFILLFRDAAVAVALFIACLWIAERLGWL